MKKTKVKKVSDKTMREVAMELSEQLRKSEMEYWAKLHPRAKVTWNKKTNEMLITYPLPDDYELMSKFIKNL